MKTQKSILLGTAGLCMLGLITACGSGGSKPATSQGNNSQSATNAQSGANSQPQKGGTITVAEASEPDILDPEKTSSGYAWQVLNQLGSSLVFENPKTYKIEPYLATSWDTSKDGLTWTFHLRHGVTFQDGTPLTAQVFVKTYERALDPKIGGGAAAGNLAEVKSITAPDDYTLVFTLKQPFAPFLTYLADNGYMQPVDPSALSKEGSNYGRQPVSSGPWIFNNWKSGQSITLTRNPNYKWAPGFYSNSGPVYPDKLVFKFISSDQTTVAALKTGEVDVAPVQPKDISQFKNNPKFHVETLPTLGEDMVLAFNLDNSALKNLQVRQAINEAVNKQAIIQAAESGQGTPLYGPLPPSFPDADPNVKSYGYHYNPSDAASLLQQAGYSKGSDGMLTKNGSPLTLNMIILPGEAMKLAAQLIQAQLKQVGIQVKIDSVDAATFMQRGGKGQYDIALFTWGYSDPDILYLLFDSSQIGALNFNRLNDPNLDKLLVQARTTTDQSQRKQLYFQIQKQIVQQAYWDPLLIANNYLVVNNRVHGMQLTAFNGYSFQDAWVTQK